MLVSTKLLDPIHETGLPILGLITILCLKFLALQVLQLFELRSKNQIIARFNICIFFYIEPLIKILRH